MTDGQKVLKAKSKGKGRFLRELKQNKILFIMLIPAPVSYTHLDVYKRQVYGYLHDYKGRPTYQGMIEEAGIDLIQPEFDTAWMICSGNDPIELLKKYRGHVDIPVSYTHLQV